MNQNPSVAAVIARYHLVLLLLILSLAGCAGHSPDAVQQQQTVVAESVPVTPLIVTRSPVFVLQGVQDRHNRIGRVEALGEKGSETVIINTKTPVIYAKTVPFSTAKGTYTNLVYRIHFPGTPFSLIPFYLGAGKNVGLLVILTLDAQQQLLLVTTANTCGCYAVSIPTERLPASSYPHDWSARPLSVFGERLPARLPSLQENETIAVVVRADVHRAMDLHSIPKTAPDFATARAAEVAALETLKKLPLHDGSYTSFYYENWPLSGHVKGAIKPWESLFLSLISLDFFVGMDKEYGDTRESGNPFYTSLKPWNRESSDMNDFAAYLRFQGWNL